MKGVASVRFVLAPSPKFQKRFVIVPVEVSVRVTWRGQAPLVGETVKLALGGDAEEPRTALVLDPPLAVEKMTLLLNEPALVGANRTIRLVEPKPARLKGEPERMPLST